MDRACSRNPMDSQLPRPRLERMRNPIFASMRRDLITSPLGRWPPLLDTPYPSPVFFHPVKRMDTAVIDHLSVLSDAIRVRMLYILEGRELTVSEICDVMQLPQSTVSRHLKTLAEGEWVASRRDGRSEEHTSELQSLAYLV